MLGVHRGFVAEQRQRDGFGIALRMMADGQRGLLRPIMELNPGYLEAAFDEVGRGYGSFNEFMYRGLGMDEQAMAQLLAALLV